MVPHPSLGVTMSSSSEVQFLRPSEAAALAGLSTRSIYTAIRRGELQASKLCSRLRITREAFDEWVSACAVQPDVPPPTFVPAPRVPVPPPPAGSFRALLVRSDDAPPS